MEKPLISIIIPTYNSQDTIKRCIDSLLSQTIPKNKFEVIIADDGSTDHTVKIANEAGADRILTCQHISVGNARNIGAKSARGDLLVFIDSDCEAKRNWLEVIQKELVNNNAISGAILNGNDTLVSWSEYLLEFSDFDANLRRSSIKFAAGANQAYKKNIFFKGGGFEVSKNHSEDVLLGMALQRSGNTINFVPEMQVYHYGRTTLESFLDNMERFGIRCYNDSRVNNSIYTKLTKNRWYIPLVFIIKFGARFKRALKAKRLSLFFICLPIILLGDLAFCKGILKGFDLDQ